jgi:tRNA pseudouridine13 synthase
MLPGELMSHYPFGKIFIAEELDVESDKFYKKDRVPTGLLPGKRVKISEGLAQEFEKDFDKKTFEDGARRFAWVFPDEIESNYKEDKNWFELSFTLPKGSYATQVISEIIH